MRRQLAAAVLVIVFGTAGLLATAAGGAPTPGPQLVEIHVTGVSVAAGRTLQLAAAGLYSDGSMQDLTTRGTWASSDKQVAAVSNKKASRGLVTGLAAGTATISVTEAGVTGSTTVIVTDATLVEIPPVLP